MNRIILAFMFATIMSVSWAADKVLGGNPDLRESPILEHGPGEKVHAPQMGSGDEYGSQLIKQPSDHSHDDDARQAGEGDQYGSVLLDQKR